jgi:hypothetical protein
MAPHRPECDGTAKFRQCLSVSVQYRHAHGVTAAGVGAVSLRDGAAQARDAPVRACAGHSTTQL